MHEKLSEAVKLYDQLLTAQVSHPPWRTSSGMQPTSSSYAQQQQTPVSYGQWSVPNQAVPTSPQVQPAQPSYFQGPMPERQTNGVPTATSEQYTQPVANYAQHSQQPQTYSVISPPPITIPQYQGYSPAIEAPPVTPTPAPVQSPPPIAPQPSTYHAPPPPSFSTPTQSPAAQPVIARHSSMTTYPSQTSSGQSSYLSRAKTVSHAPQQLQQLQNTTVPQQPLLNFPVAPTAPPQAYQSYTSPPPVEEREALLIDL